MDHQTSIISIDVGGVFLMDILINESDSSSSSPTSMSPTSLTPPPPSSSTNHQYHSNNQLDYNHHLDYHQYPQNHTNNNKHININNSSSSGRYKSSRNNCTEIGGAAGVFYNSKYCKRNDEDIASSYYYHPYRLGYTEMTSDEATPTHNLNHHLYNNNDNFRVKRQQYNKTNNILWQPDYLGSSLHRLARVINDCDEQYPYPEDEDQTTGYMMRSDNNKNINNFEDFDEGFAPGSSSGASLSSASSNFSGCSEEDDEEDEEED